MTLTDAEIQTMLKSNDPDVRRIAIKRGLEAMTHSESRRGFLVGATLAAQVRQVGEFTDRALWLSDQFEWTMTQDSNGQTVVVPKRKSGF